MSLTYKKTWFEKYKFTLKVSPHVSPPNKKNRWNKYKKIKDWLATNSPNVKLTKNNIGDLVELIPSYTFILTSEAAIAFKMEFM